MSAAEPPAGSAPLQEPPAEGGSAPAPDPGSVPHSIRAYAVLPSGVHAIPPERAVQMMRGSGDVTPDAPPMVWIDVVKPGSAEADFLRTDLGFHPLAVEDCVRGRQRPKLDRYPGYFFLVFYAAAVNPQRKRVALHEVHLFLGRGFIVTVHDQRVKQVSEVIARWRASPSFFDDIGSLAHALLDSLVDGYFPVLDHFAERSEQIEAAVFDGSDEAPMQQILALRRELVMFRRVIAPQRDVLGTLLRRDLPFLKHDLYPYLQDVHDHTIRVTEEIDALRDLLAATLDGYLSLASNQLNQTMRLMTAWSIILMSMALVAGIYGMNFAWMPELGWRWGYFAVLGLMIGLGAGLVLFFRRRRWI